MNKKELIDALAKEAKTTKTDAESVLNAYIQVVTKSLKKGDKVTLPGFCTMERVSRKAKTARNPRTGDPIKVPAKKAAKFKAGKTLNDALN